MKLTRTAIYALRAVFLISKHETENPISSRQLAKHGDMPERFLLQILHDLVSGGILKSVQGIFGGYLLRFRPNKLTVLDVVEAASGPIEPQSLDEHDPDCSFTKNLQRLLEKISRQQRCELGAVTIADLMSADSGK